jgi:hypothetical protein
MMSADEYSVIFQLVDDYARMRHSCFLAELFLNETKTEYTLCFRPADASRDAATRYKCRYLRIAEEEARTAGEEKELPAAMIEKLDKELAELGTSI